MVDWSYLMSRALEAGSVRLAGQHLEPQFLVYCPWLGHFICLITVDLAEVIKAAAHLDSLNLDLAEWLKLISIVCWQWLVLFYL